MAEDSAPFGRRRVEESKNRWAGRPYLRLVVSPPLRFLNVTRTERACITLDRLREAIPRPDTELQYRTEFVLCVDVIHSAQCTDSRMILAKPTLYTAYTILTAMA